MSVTKSYQKYEPHYKGLIEMVKQEGDCLQYHFEAEIDRKLEEGFMISGSSFTKTNVCIPTLLIRGNYIYNDLCCLFQKNRHTFDLINLYFLQKHLNAIKSGSAIKVKWTLNTISWLIKESG